MLRPPDILHSRILIVDDQAVNVLLLERMLLGAGYVSVTSTLQPVEVVALHLQHHYDLILLDLQMPGLDGFQVMEALKTLEPDGYLPVLVVTAQPEQKLRALQAGAKDFVSKPFQLAEVLARVHNMLEVRLLHRQLHQYSAGLASQLRERTADLQESYLETIYTMTRAVENKDVDIGAHGQRISHYCRALAQLLNLPDADVDGIFFASPMHDVGKIGIPDHILTKVGRLTPDEWVIMKRHTTIGSQILGHSKSAYLRLGAEIALSHHECWNGAGYPHGTQGNAIPLAARILNLCDVYDALRSKRPYKPAFDHAKTLEILTHGDGCTQPEHFDPAILAVLQQNQQVFSDIFDTFPA